MGLVATEDRTSINEDVQELLKMDVSNLIEEVTENGAERIAEIVLQ